MNNSPEWEATDGSQTPESQRFQEALKRLDWDAMARAWHEGDIRWHAKEWKQFIEHIQQEAEQRGRDMAVAELVRQMYGETFVPNESFKKKMESARTLNTK